LTGAPTGGNIDMSDLLFLGLGLAGFAAMLGFAVFCQHH
jgi:hypothetical protein